MAAYEAGYKVFIMQKNGGIELNQLNEKLNAPAASLAERQAVGRIALEHKHTYRILTEGGELLGRVSGKFAFEALATSDYPAVGDWVIADVLEAEGKAVIQRVLPRTSSFSRKAAGFTSDEQLIAANADYVFVVSSLNRDFNVRRTERYLVAVADSGAEPVIVLTKADACLNPEYYTEQLKSLGDLPVFVVSALDGTGIEGLLALLGPGKTGVFTGSSGVGKSTLVNRLIGDARMDTGGIRESDERGKHTTTHRELILLPNGGAIIDTPGMRELQLAETEDLDASFPDIERLSESCRFRDCRHQAEAGCAVRQAVAEGELEEGRLRNYMKMQRELAHVEQRAKQQEKLQEKRVEKRNRKRRKGGRYD